MTNESIRTAVEQYFENAKTDDWDKVKTAIADANSNLYYGPMEDQEMGFEEAVKFLSDWADEYVEELYFDQDIATVSNVRPEEYVECYECNGYGVEEDGETDCFLCDGEGTVESGAWEFTTVVPEAEVKRILFGKELAPYIR